MRRILLATLLGLCGAASAAPVHVDFAIYQSQKYSGERRGVYFGSWSFDSSLAKPNAIFEDVFAGIPLDSFSFYWLGERWHPGNARLARIEFDANGELRSWTIGSTVTSGGCGAVGALDCVSVPSVSPDFTLTATRREPGIPSPALIAVGALPQVEAFAEGGGVFAVRKRTSLKRK